MKLQNISKDSCKAFAVKKFSGNAKPLTDLSNNDKTHTCIQTFTYRIQRKADMKHMKGNLIPIKYHSVLYLWHLSDCQTVRHKTNALDNTCTCIITEVQT